jgi:endoglucanase
MSFNIALRTRLQRHAFMAAALLLGTWACSRTSSSQTAAVQPTPTTCTASGGEFAIHVCGNRLVDGAGRTVQLRGVSVSGLETVAIQGWAPGDPWGGQAPDFSAVKAWGANTVRIPLNEASWRGGACIDASGSGSTVTDGSKVQNKAGQTVKADPGSNYQATIASTVARATAARLYVILDLHLTAPGNVCPMAQNAMADIDHSVAFWSSLAGAYKGFPNVIFELFNEPFLDQTSLQDSTPWLDLINGQGTLGSYITQGNPSVISYTWKNAGMQQMLDAVRAAGATNVILTSTLAYSSSMGGWLQYHPTDTLKPSQVGAVWHAYPNDKDPSLVNCVGSPTDCSAQTMDAAKAILAAGYPVVITEFGDAVGGATSPLSSVVLPFADANGMSYLAWTWNAWPSPKFVLIKDVDGTPTSGFGVYVKAHYLCRAAGTASCK